MPSPLKSPTPTMVQPLPTPTQHLVLDGGAGLPRLAWLVIVVPFMNQT